MSGKYILRMAEDGYLTQKNINLAFLRCIGVRVEFWVSERGKPPEREVSMLIVSYRLSSSSPPLGTGKAPVTDCDQSSLIELKFTKIVGLFSGKFPH